MWNNFLADNEVAWSDIDVVLLKNAENIMNRAYEKRTNFKKNKNYEETDAKNEKWIAEMLRTYNEERRRG